MGERGEVNVHALELHRATVTTNLTQGARMVVTAVHEVRRAIAAYTNAAHSTVKKVGGGRTSSPDIRQQRDRR